MRRRALRVELTLLVVAAGLVVAACGGGGPSGTETASPPAGTGTPSAIPSFQFSPQPQLGPAVSPKQSLDLLTASPLLTVRAANLADIQTGISSLATGDFNRDGVKDLLIGLPFADGPDNSREDAGEAVVIFGGRELKGEIELGKDAVGLQVLGALAGDNLGFGVAAGDLNGDGIDDVIVGAPGSNGLANIRTDLGEAYVIFGRAGLGGVVDTLHEQQDFTLIAAEGFARVGTSFAVADVNGDEIADLVAGAPFGGRQAGAPVGGPRTTVGEVYVVFGSRGLQGRVSVAEDQQDLILSGVKELDAFGQAVAATDVNGDGIADIIVGSRGYDGADGARDSAGAVFVFFGSGGVSGKLGIDDANVAVLGAKTGDALGEVLTSGDLNGDGLADIVAVSRTDSGPDGRRTNAGAAYVVFGSRSLSGTLDLASGAANATVYGVEPSSLLATSVDTRDLDGNGRDDIVLGTALAGGNGRSLSGVTYVVFDQDLPGTVDLREAPANSLFVYGAAQGDGLGTGVAIGDINGDGRPELILAAAGPTQGQQRPARIYAIDLP